MIAEFSFNLYYASGGTQSAFETKRREFDVALSKIQKAIISTPPPIDELQQFLENIYNYLHPQIVPSISINEILTVVRDHSTLIDISCLEGIVEYFDIKKAESHTKVQRCCSVISSKHESFSLSGRNIQSNKNPLSSPMRNSCLCFRLGSY